jgi:hypothetical protein
MVSPTLRVDHLDDGADDVARRAELAQFAGLLDLPQHVLEQIALGVGVGLVQAQAVDQVTTWVSTVGSSIAQPRAVHEIVRGTRSPSRRRRRTPRRARSAPAVRPTGPSPRPTSGSGRAEWSVSPSSALSGFFSVQSPSNRLV